MNAIKKINLISGLVPEDKLNQLIAAAEQVKQSERIEFKILGADDKVITVQATQAKIIDQARKSEAAILSLTKKLFQKYLKETVLNVLAIPFEDHHISQIDSVWIQQRMKETGTKAKDIVADTGLQKGTISNWVNGNKPLTQIAKALFYYYFLSHPNHRKNP